MNFDKVKILVAGIGGGGCNAIRHMLSERIADVEFVCVNTDVKDLSKVSDSMHLPIGTSRTKGQGAGGRPEEGRAAAMEDKEEIIRRLKDVDMLFITAGMGGGTGTGAAPIVAEAARELGVLTVAVVTTPFNFEGKLRQKVAEQGLDELRDKVDSLLVISNEKLVTNFSKDITAVEGFAAVNDILLNAVRGISDLVTQPGEINVDFADVCSVMRDKGLSMMGTGFAEGEDAAIKAVDSAIGSPLLDNLELKDASGILVNVTGNSKLSIADLAKVGERMEQCGAGNAQIITGMLLDENMPDGIKVTVVVTGITAKPEFNVHHPVDAPDTPSSDQGDNTDFMDVPTFLRRQMD